MAGDRFPGKSSSVSPPAAACSEEGYLRRRLEAADPQLYQNLLECWRQADEWLSALGTNKGSSNSYPHLRNVERHLDYLVYLIETRGGRIPFQFSGAELWLLLASVLFHDVGRLKDDKGGEKGDNEAASDGVIPHGCWVVKWLAACGSPVAENQSDWERLEESWRCEEPEKGLAEKGPAERLLEAKGKMWFRESPLRDLAGRPHCRACIRHVVELGGQNEGEKPASNNLMKAMKACPQKPHLIGPSGLAKSGRCVATNQSCPAFCLMCIRHNWHREKMMRLRSEELPSETDHSVHSYRMLHDASVFPQLGLNVPGLVESLAKICLFHGDEAEIRSVYTPGMLNTIVLDPYGEIREREIASLLLLADHMDASFRRVIPPFLHQDRPLETIGRFRQRTRGLTVVAPCHMIITELGDWSQRNKSWDLLTALWRKAASQPPPGPLFVRLGLRHLAKGYRLLNPTSDMWWDAFCSPPPEDEPGQDTVEAGASSAGRALTLMDRALRDMQIEPRFWETESSLCLASHPEVGMEITDRGQDAFLEEMARDTAILRVVLKDVQRNAQALDRVGFQLNTMGLPIWAWLVEYEEHLYTADGLETFEPIFDVEYLVRVVEAMWTLSQEVFGQSEFTYESLAAHLREPEVEKVRTAVRRISIVTRDLSTKKEDGMSGQSRLEEVIWAGQTLWKWNNHARETRYPLEEATAKVVQATARLREWEEQNQEAVKWLEAFKSLLPGQEQKPGRGAQGSEARKKEASEICDGSRSAKIAALPLLTGQVMSELRQVQEIARREVERGTAMRRGASVGKEATASRLLRVFEAVLLAAKQYHDIGRGEQERQQKEMAAKLITEIALRENEEVAAVGQQMGRIIAQASQYMAMLLQRYFLLKAHGYFSGCVGAEKTMYEIITPAGKEGEALTQVIHAMASCEHMAGEIEREQKRISDTRGCEVEVVACLPQDLSDTEAIVFKLIKYKNIIINNGYWPEGMTWQKLFDNKIWPPLHLGAVACPASQMLKAMLALWQESPEQIMPSKAKEFIHEIYGDEKFGSCDDQIRYEGSDLRRELARFEEMVASWNDVDALMGEAETQEGEANAAQGGDFSAFLLRWALSLHQMAEVVDRGWPVRQPKPSEFEVVTGRDVCQRIKSLANPYYRTSRS